MKDWNDESMCVVLRHAAKIKRLDVMTYEKMYDLNEMIDLTIGMRIGTVIVLVDVRAIV